MRAPSRGGLHFRHCIQAPFPVERRCISLGSEPPRRHVGAGRRGVLEKFNVQPFQSEASFDHRSSLHYIHSSFHMRRSVILTMTRGAGRDCIAVYQHNFLGEACKASVLPGPSSFLYDQPACPLPPHLLLPPAIPNTRTGNHRRTLKHLTSHKSTASHYQ